MNIKYYYPIWSIQDLTLPKALLKIKQCGYDGAEIALNDTMDLPAIKLLFEEVGLELLAQHPFSDGENFEVYRTSFIQKLRAIITTSPVLINCHTGRDYYSLEENLQVIHDADTLASEHDIVITHEIHRGRFSYSPMAIAPYLNAYPKLRLTADFSHWCVVSESLLEKHDSYLNKTFPHCLHIHARVGNEESPQVNDPFAPEHANTLKQHLSWWKAIYAYQLKKGAQELPITCEFGPPPYLQTLPYSQEPVASIWDINLRLMGYLKNHLK